MSELNIYASRIFGEHPLAIWPLDNFDSGTSTQYSSMHYPALIGTETENNMDVGVPLCYGSSGSLKLYPEPERKIGVSQIRIWEKVHYEPDTGKEQHWTEYAGIDYGKLLVEEQSIVMVNAPSIEYESYGMFSEEGKYNSYTAEMWIRIDARSNYAQKIWGNVAGFDGLWVMDNYLILQVGDQWKSYAIENWYRPMLVAVTYTPEQARLVINGQEVISLKLDPTATDFTQKIVADPIRASVHLLGFICPDDALIYEVDNFSIFPYIVPDLALKRRFVWGQGVENISDISNAYQTNTIYFDYPFAEYANNVIFPDLWTWETGYLDGFVSTGKSLRTPAYELPEIFIAGRDLDALYLENQFNNSVINNDVPWFTFKPEYDWDMPSYLRFNNIEKLTEKVQSIVGVFETIDAEKYPLMVFKKTWSNDEVRISVEDDKLIYEHNGVEIARETQTGRFAVGFDLNRIVNGTDFPQLRSFFSSVSDVELFVGGDGVTTFNGKIYRVGLSDTSNMARQEFASAFRSNGIVYPELQYLFIEKYCTYTLRPFMAYGKFWLDVAANAYWEANVPLEVLAQNIQTNDGNWNYERTLDSFQINFGYDGEYTIVDDYYKFDNAELKTYISFQPTTMTEEEKETFLFRNLAPTHLHKNRIVDASTDFERKAYEIINGTVVIPPAPEGYQVVIYFISNAKSVIRSPMYVKSLSFASLASLDERNTINTLYGIPVSSASRFAITKENLPYLYLTKDSGIEPLDGPVHIDVSSTNSEYNMGLLNMFIKPNFANMDGDVLFEIRYNSDTVQFKGDKTTGMFDLSWGSLNAKTKHTQMFKNGEPIYAYNADGTIAGTASMKLVDNQWAFIGFEFPEVLGMSEADAGIDLYPGAVYQNIMSSKIGGAQIQQNIITRKWEEVHDGDTKLWSDWAGINYLELLTEGKYLEYPVDPSDLYNLFTGHNSFVFDDGKNATIRSLESKAHTNVRWDTFDRRPA